MGLLEWVWYLKYLLDLAIYSDIKGMLWAFLSGFGM